MVEVLTASRRTSNQTVKTKLTGPLNEEAAPVPPVEDYLSEHTDADKDKLKSVGGVPCDVLTILVLSAVLCGFSAPAPKQMLKEKGDQFDLFDPIFPHYDTPGCKSTGRFAKAEDLAGAVTPPPQGR